ncbi:SH2 domain-containing protein B-like isoform X2 [Aristolochia californica]|uniref:SH2 domain-containing protein B-like isoform X2 n=1 Tax=Aristolochia californica TaxID=171875 RepID=UPI0035D91B24
MFLDLSDELNSSSSNNHSTDLLTTSPCGLTDIQFPLEKWVHLGCEVDLNVVRLHIDGEVVAEKSLLPKEDSYQENLQRVTLMGNDGGDDRLQGYVHHVQLLPWSSSVKDHIAKDPPLVLCIDGSLISENHDVEEGRDGVWSVIGGKASCRRNFSLDVVLVDALGRSVNREMELVASLVYADNGCPVEKPQDDSDAPLLISYDGVEYPSTDRAIKLLHGRASFKLKISQLSSKCDGRLFRVHFESLKGEKFPFLEAHSRPIHCISRNRTIRSSPASWKKPNTAADLPDGRQLSGADEGSPEVQNSKGDSNPQLLNPNELMQSFSPKRIKLSHDKSSAKICVTSTSQHPEVGLHLTAHEDENFDNLEGTDHTPSDSESVHARNSASKTATDITNPITDLILFKYCLEGMHERSMLLREILTTAGDHDIVEFAEQVALYTGCSHNRNQIIIAKGLVQEGTETWNSIPRNTHEALWKNAAREIERRFMKISRCSSRSLSGQDMELFHRMAGSRDSISRDDFDRMWCWLYPVADALSKDQLNAIWKCTSPQWIEGFITKDEAEASLREPGVHMPGAFILRFPTSRSWPHPDAGSLVLTYVGADYAIHHRLLALHDSGNGDMNQRPLQELLLAEPELTQLARVTRHQPIYCG